MRFAARGIFNTRSVVLGVSVAMLAGYLGASSATAAEVVRPNVSSSTSSHGVEASTDSSKHRCARNGDLKNGGVVGLASVGGQRIESASVSVFGRGANDAPGRFTKKLKINGSHWTNAVGGFQFTVDCLPATYLVKVTGGRINGRLLKQRMWGLGRASERGIVVSPVTTLPVEYLRIHGGKVTTAIKKVTKFLKVVNLGNEASDFGLATRVTSRNFSPSKFVLVAKTHGGVKAFSRKLAKRVKKNSHRMFKPRSYSPPTRPGYPKVGSQGTPRTHANAVRFAQKSSMRGSFASSLLNSVAGKAAYSSMCAALPQSPVTNMACASPDADVLNEIANELVGISQQLDELQDSVNEVIAMLDAMDDQLDEIQTTVNEINANQLTSIQQNLKNEAANANDAYSDAYDAAGIGQVSAQIIDAQSDLQFLGTITPVSSFTKVAPGSSNEAICGTMYSSLNDSTGHNPLSICADFLSQTDAFKSGANSYYSTLYRGLVGGSGIPQNNLLIWTYQDMLTFGGNVPVSAQTLANMQTQVGQVGVLMDTAYAMLASAQMFEYTATTGGTTTCTTLTTSGTFSSTTAINIADACNTLQTALFAASVMNQQAPQVSVPMTDTVADPKTNYIYWAYPFDATGATSPNSAQFPFYSGTSQKYSVPTYSDGTPISAFNLSLYVAYGNSKCCSVANYKQAHENNPAEFPIYPLVEGSSAYTFWTATQSQLLSLFTNLFLEDPTSIASTLQDSGFQGIGTNKFGMSWTKLGADTGTVGVSQTTNWNSTTPSTAKGCTGAPPNYTGSLYCAPGTILYPTNLNTASVSGILATSNWDMMGNVVPDGYNASLCNTVGTWTYNNGSTYPATAGNAKPATLCEANTFGLMVDTLSQSPDGKTAGRLPPFWSTKMLNGPSSSGVPAMTVSQPTVYRS